MLLTFKCQPRGWGPTQVTAHPLCLDLLWSAEHVSMFHFKQLVPANTFQHQLTWHLLCISLHPSEHLSTHRCDWRKCLLSKTAEQNVAIGQVWNILKQSIYWNLVNVYIVGQCWFQKVSICRNVGNLKINLRSWSGDRLLLGWLHYFILKPTRKCSPSPPQGQSFIPRQRSKNRCGLQKVDARI